MSSKTTIVDVARECGLSQATVARVLNGQKEIQVKEQTRKRVLYAAKKIGYERNVLAANFRRQKTKNIAISIADLTNPFFPELIICSDNLSSFEKRPAYSDPNETMIAPVNVAKSTINFGLNFFSV